MYSSQVIKSFADIVTEKLFLGDQLTRKESNKLGKLNPIKAFERLAILNEAMKKPLSSLPHSTTTNSKAQRNTR